ncbi:MAG TPA: 16S rRNA (uracil(1498)-N(3))-methyltransferase [Bacteroidia bacterium]|nr:16S rRNA (uracil(1498)-N(3))-methyltransferase [Bacteroidia bacterium]
MHLFYVPDLSGDSVYLSEEESKHAVRVLRLKNSDIVELVDGKGTRAYGRIANDHPKRCGISITEKKTELHSRNYSIHLAIAPTKNAERIEWMLEKCTETGLDEITFLDCENSERSRINMERMEKVAVSAMKQSRQSRLPLIHPLTDFEKFISQDFHGQKFIAHCSGNERKNFAAAVGKGKNVLVLIGPEGDFSPEEIRLADSNGFGDVSFGDNRLRTETAGLFAVAGIHIVNAAP